MVSQSKGYYKPEIVAKFYDAMNEAKEAGIVAKLARVSISAANKKMGAVASVSLLPFITCPARCKGTCAAECYAAKLANLRANVRKAWANNTALVISNPREYWRQVREAVAAVRFFRFHVSGDILDYEYFVEMVNTAADNPHTEILAFTKRYEVVNSFVASHGGAIAEAIPSNLHILFSGWDNLKPINPFGFPETIVYHNESEIREEWLLCGGNCLTCGCRGLGCWKAKAGEIVAFKKH